MKHEDTRRRGIGSHTKPNRGEFDEWITPKGILWALGEFDLDPCGAPEPRPWDTAKRHYTKPKEDGLTMPWEGRVWLNPPYGDDVGLWMKRMAEHQNGTALTFARTETAWWRLYVWPKVCGVMFLYGRLNFCFPDGSVSPYNSGGPSALLAYSERDATVLKGSGIRGAYVRVVQT